METKVWVCTVDGCDHVEYLDASKGSLDALEHLEERHGIGDFDRRS